MRVSVAAAALLVACTAFDDLQYPLPDAGATAIPTPAPDASVAVDAGFACTGPHLRRDGTDDKRCYRFNPNRVHWDVAEADCVAWGGHLVSIHSKAELEFVRALVRDEERATPASTGAWIGLNSRGNAGVFTWTDATDSTYRHWADHEPDFVAATPKECVYQYGDQYEGHWDNFQCTVVEAESVCAR